MSEYSDLANKVAQLTQRLNDITVQARKIPELPEQNPLVPSSQIHVNNAGTSQRVDIQQIIDATLSIRDNELLSIGTITVSGNDVYIPSGATWLINNVIYSNPSNITINVPYASPGNARIDILVADTNNLIYRVNGPEGPGVSPTPSVPLNTVLVTAINVTDATIGYTPPIIGTYDFIKSNESLNLAKRRSNVLYGILDQYTGEEMTLIKINYTPYLVDGIIYFVLGSEYFKRVYSDYVNVKWWGAIGDNETDNQIYLSKAIDFIIDERGGKIFIPSDGIYITSPVVVPMCTLLDGIIIPIEIIGQTSPSQLFGTAGTLPPLGQAGSVIKCLDTNLNSSIISTIADSSDPFGFSAINLIIRNIEFRTYPNPLINAINANYAMHFICENVQVSTGQYSVDCQEPTHNVSGIITPHKNNGALISLRNISVSGYFNGIMVNEHTDGDILNITCCKNGLVFEEAFHASRIGRVGLYRNTYNATWNGVHVVHIEQFNLEHADGSEVGTPKQWQITIYDVVDTTLKARGEIAWTLVIGNVGISQNFLKNGGHLIKYTNSNFYQPETQSGYWGGAFRIKAVTGVDGSAPSNSRPWEFTNDIADFGNLEIRVGNSKEAIINTDFTTILKLSKEGKATFSSTVSASAAVNQNDLIRLDQLLNPVLSEYLTNADAILGGLPVGRIYKTPTGEIRIVV